MKQKKILRFFIFLFAIISLSQPAYVLSLNSNALYVNSDKLTLSFSSNGSILAVNAENHTFPLKTKNFFSIKNMGKSESSDFADADNPLFFFQNKWKIKNKKSAHNNDIKIDGKRLNTSFIEIASAGKINIDLTAISKGKNDSAITFSIRQYDSKKTEIKSEKPVAFRFNTRESKTGDTTNKRFSFSPSPLSKFITLSIIPSQGIDIFSCKKLSIYKVRDRRLMPVDMEITPTDNNEIELSGKSGNFGLTVSFEENKKYIICKGNLKSLNNQESAATVRFSLPFPSDNLFWHDTLSNKRFAEKSTVYSNWHKLGGERFFSVYPFSLVTSGDAGVAYAIPPKSPRIFRTGYSTEEGYFIEFDLGLSPETKKFPNSASFTFIIYGQESEWGLRETANYFYDFFPQSFKKINKDEGIWFAWVDSKTIYLPQDFGFMFDTTPDRSYYLDRYYAFNSFFYQEPYGIVIPWEKSNLLTHIPEDVPYEKIIKKITSHSFINGKVFQTSNGEKNYVSAAIESAMKNEEDKYYIGYYKPYMITNPDPELPYGKLATERVSFRQGKAEREGNSKTGQYIDSVVPGWWAIKEDYKKENFRYADIPLSFSYETGKPAELGVFPSYELFSEISKITRSYGGLTLANTWYPMQTFYYGLIDIIGAGEYSSDQPVDNFHYLRSIASTKTLSFIDNGLIVGNLSEKEIEKRFMKCLAFAVYPGTFPFRDSSKYERLRPFYRKFIPSIKLISSAGWNPITFASASHPSLNVEKFGNSDNNLYFTIYNPTNKEISFIFEIQPKALSNSQGENLFYYNILSGGMGQFNTIGEKQLIQLTIGAEKTLLLQAGTKKNILSSKLFLAGELSKSLGDFFIEPVQTDNLLKNISIQKNSKFEYDNSSPYISGVKVENESSGETSVFRVNTKAETRKVDYRIEIEYFTERKEPEKRSITSKMYCLLYSMAKFLSTKTLPDITTEVLITDDEGKLITNKGLQREELKESSELNVLSRRFYVPAESERINITFKVQGNFNILHLKNIKVFPSGNAYAIFKEKKLVNSLNKIIKDFYKESTSQSLFNEISENILSEKQSIEDAQALTKSIIDKSEEHLQAIEKLRKKLTAPDRRVKEYILRLNNFIKEIESIDDFIRRIET